MAHAFLQPVMEWVATTFELLPERVDLLSLVVEMAACPRSWAPQSSFSATKELDGSRGA
jgi:hypothetical protein